MTKQALISQLIQAKLLLSSIEAELRPKVKKPRKPKVNKYDAIIRQRLLKK